ncbi:MAG TPA: GerMN domain-containing protein [Clostridiales bacterium]|nr:GerMN domain-containing protein [Clostridiales bacterium]
MKKIILSFGIIMLMIFLGACNKGKQGNGNETTPMVTPDITQPAEGDSQNGEVASQEGIATIADYYPMLADTEYVYEGEGNEYASYSQITDFLNAADNRIQTRTNNGGTETVRVIEIKKGKLEVIKTVNECYYRDNLMLSTVSEDPAEILLMEPLVQGTQWTLPDGRKRYISAVDVEVTTPSGSYKAIEVTTENGDNQSKDYYAPQVGLVKSVFQAEDMEVISSLKAVNSNQPYKKTIDIYYPDVDEKLYIEPLELTFHTGDETKDILQKAISREAEKDTYLPLTSVNTKINSLSLSEDGIVQVDFSKEFIQDMNVGAGYEMLILQGITNTLGAYYQAEEVVLTVDGKPYESGHILMKEGETLRVDMDNVASK